MRLLAVIFTIPLLLGSGLRAEERLLGLDLYRPVAENNELTPAKIRLGARLFRERRLSRDGSLACADCHQPKRAFTDGRATAVGVFGREGPRSVPTLINRAWGKAFFWDGRIPKLEQQVVQPILAKLEMDLTLEEAVQRLQSSRSYHKEFNRVFGRDPNPEDLASALAAYVRTINAGDSPYDRYLFGARDALTEQQFAGLTLFRGKANCTFCHAGPTLSDEEFHNTGVAWRDGKYLDEGRALVTQLGTDRGKFKTPTLREVSRTAPYMHDGSLATLEDVVKFYSDGGRDNPNRDIVLQRLNLSDRERADLVSFLRALSGTIQAGK